MATRRKPGQSKGGKPGRKSKGGTRLSVRFPETYLKRFQDEAKDLGMPASDHIANLVARASGLPEPWPVPTRADALPLELAAA